MNAVSTLVSILAAGTLACGSSFSGIGDGGDDAPAADVGADGSDGATGDDGELADGDAAQGDAGDGAAFDPTGWCCGLDGCGEGGAQWVCFTDGGAGVTYCKALTAPCAGSCAYFDPMKDADVNAKPHPCS